MRLLLSLLFLAAAVAAGFTSWARLTAPTDPDAVLSVWSQHAQSLTKRAGELYARETTSPETLSDASARLLSAMPLSETSLVLAGRAAIATDRKTEADRLFTAALSRQPRNVPARTWVAARQIEAGEFTNALESLDILKRLNPDAEEIYIQTAASLADQPGAAEALKAAVIAKQDIATRALTRLNQQSSNFGMLLDLNAHAPSKAGPVIERLFKERGAGAAFIAWLSLLPSSEATSLQWPYDNAFVGLMAPPPFNWTIADEAELQQSGGLYISFPGSSSQKPVFARQTMLIGPGQYTLQADMEGETSEEGAHFEWTISCTGSDLQIALLAVEALEPTIQSFATSFEVPPGCPAQAIMLRGKPGVFPVRARTIVRQVKIQAQEASP